MSIVHNMIFQDVGTVVLEFHQFLIVSLFVQIVADLGALVGAVAALRSWLETAGRSESLTTRAPQMGCCLGATGTSEASSKTFKHSSLEFPPLTDEEGKWTQK